MDGFVPGLSNLIERPALRLLALVWRERERREINYHIYWVNYLSVPSQQQ